ncbi:MAG TPA: redoxin domain-containing protein [Pirellulales bacterium]|nr:redoxin domain-containing protein [Pirellulales bacterium]
MLATFPLVVTASLVLTAPGPLEPGQQLLFQGTVSQRVVEPGQPSPQQKAFDLSWFVADVDAAGATLYWLVEERGRGAWPWPERFGQLKLDTAGRTQGSHIPSLYFDYGEGESVVPLPAPLVTLEKPLAAGLTWSAAGEDFEVEQERDADGRAAWPVRVHNAYGAKRTMLVDKSSPLLLATNERVFMNKGTEYALEMKLARVTKNSAEEAAATRAAFDELLALLSKLHRTPRSADTEWTPEQIAMLSRAAPGLEKAAAGGPLERLVATAGRDAKLQGGRADEVAEIINKYQGRPMPGFSLPGLAGGTLTLADLAGQVTVLHFWEYRDSPLKEPYGQVGYLEFLHQKRKDAGVKVYGVAVDGRLNEPNERRAVGTGVRKLKSFMNLTYPLLLDGGEVIKSLGDPRLVGATLPVVVVIGRDGRITHYHVGNYEVDRQEGLKELNAAVTAALKN